VTFSRRRDLPAWKHTSGKEHEMYRGKGSVAAALACAIASVGFAASASAAAIKGTVVHRNARAHSFVVATSTGRLAAVHGRRSPRLGRVVRVSARRLRNGTFAGRAIRTVGRRRHATLRGTVTWVNRRSGAFTVSAPGASLLVRRAGLRARRASAAADPTPAPGTTVVVGAHLDDQGDLEADDVQEVGHDDNGMELEGVVLAVDPQARTLTISADDDDESGQSVTVQVPDSFDMTAFQVGHEVELHVTQLADGTLQLTGSGDDEGADDADQGDDDQGDMQDAGDRHGGDQHGGATGDSSDDHGDDDAENGDD
jgi:hypothetical protein